jgi:DNA topoisomerase IB
MSACKEVCGGQVTWVAILLFHHVQSTIQDNWSSKSLRYQQRSVEEHHYEQTIFAAMFRAQFLK